jgi:maltose O-acetyltransferase
MKKLFRRIAGSIYGRLRAAYYDTRYDHFRKRYNITSNFKFSGTDIRIYGEGQLVLGNDSYMGSYSTIQLSAGTKVIIGDKCQISHNVRMYTSTDISDQDFLGPERRSKLGNITIGDGIWIGANVFINPGITIGNNSIVAANSVVTKDVPENSIVGGVPAKLIRFKEYKKE